MTSNVRFEPVLWLVIECINVPPAILICGINCVDSLEYANSKKLICYTPKVIGSGDIIVSTFSGGAGSCNVSFLGLEPEAAPVLGEYVAACLVLSYSLCDVCGVCVCVYECDLGVVGLCVYL